MQAASALAYPQDRVCDWFLEVERIAEELPSLRPAARLAVRNVLVAIMREEEGATHRLVSVLTAMSDEY